MQVNSINPRTISIVIFLLLFISASLFSQESNSASTPSDRLTKASPSSLPSGNGIAKGAPAAIPTDTDGDGICDFYEDTDGNGDVDDDDADGDGVMDYQDTDDDGDGVLTYQEILDPNGDCNPDDAPDTDGDGVPDYLDIDSDDDGSPDGVDCDRLDPNVHPGADEICDGVDNDCDGESDNDAIDTSTWYLDNDEDGYGDHSVSVMACEEPEGYVSNDQDCDDSDAYIHPGADEVCDGVDNDCDGESDNDAIDTSIWYLDNDEDGYGDHSVSVMACEEPEGYVSNDQDCDDSDASIHPDADEICDGVDNDCDGESDNDAIDTSTWYLDNDEDGYGDHSVSVLACEEPEGYVSNDQDCDDSDAYIHPGADEICDGVDNDCDGESDNDAIDTSTWYLDNDDDGYGDHSVSVLACEEPEGYVSNDQDCDDSDNSVSTYKETNIAATICEGESYFAGDEEFTQTGNYTVVIEDPEKCDSVINISLTVYHVYNSEVDVSICRGDSYFAGGMTQTNSGSYIDEYTSIYGCDSVITTNLTVHELPQIDLGSDVSISDSIVLDAGIGYENYLWSTGSDERELTVRADWGVGEHEVWVSVSDANSCENSDTVVVTIENTTHLESDKFEGISIYPNPTNGIVYIENENNIRGIDIQVISVNGAIVLRETLEGEWKYTLNLGTLEGGIYILKISSDKMTTQRKLVLEK